MGVHSEFVKRTAGFVKKLGGIVAELEATHGPFRLFSLVTGSAHVPDSGNWDLIASAGWMDKDLDVAAKYLRTFIKDRVGPDDYRHLSGLGVKLESEAPVFQIQHKLGWWIRENGVIGNLVTEEPWTIWMVYRCLPNGDEFLESTSPAGERPEPPWASELKERLDTSVVPIEVQQKIITMARPPGWYGEGSGEITQEACWASIDFVSRAKQAIHGLDYPRIGPSPMGAVALQWDFDDVSFIVKISCGQPGFVGFQEEGFDFHQEAGVATREDVLAKLSTIARKHVFI